MSEAVSYDSAAARPSRRWTIVATAGCAAVALVLLTSALVVGAKPLFGWLVGPRFLPTLAIIIMAGGLALIVSGLNLGHVRNWRSIAMIVWGAGAMITPFFGYLFLLPMGVLGLTLPVVIAALVSLWRR